MDRIAICEALKDGTIDAIATDHAPHSELEKKLEFDRAANGITGLETSLSLSLKLVDDGFISFNDLVRLMSVNPASVIGKKSSLEAGKVADITIIDTELRWSVDAKNMYSKSVNTPFDGWDLKGRAVYTIVDGNVVYEYDDQE